MILEVLCNPGHSVIPVSIGSPDSSVCSHCCAEHKRWVTQGTTGCPMDVCVSGASSGSALHVLPLLFLLAGGGNSLLLYISALLGAVGKLSFLPACQARGCCGAVLMGLCRPF